MREEINISIVNLCNYIFENNENEVDFEDNFLNTFINKNKNFKIFKNINFFKDENNFLAIFEHKNYILSLNLNHFDFLDISLLDPFLFEKGILKQLDKIILENVEINSFFNFIKEKKHYIFYQKKHLIDSLNDFGIETDNELLNFDESIDIKISDLISLMSESYLKAIKNKKI